jgi:hypothetical protein
MTTLLNWFKKFWIFISQYPLPPILGFLTILIIFIPISIVAISDFDAFRAVFDALGENSTLIGMATVATLFSILGIIVFYPTKPESSPTHDSENETPTVTTTNNTLIKNPPEKPIKPKLFDTSGNRSFVSGYKHDIFVSYTRADDEKGEVTTLINSLQKSLAQELDRTNAYSLRMDELRNNSPAISNVIEKLKKSATFLLVLSPRYLASQQCRSEIDAFLTEIDKVSERVFVVEVNSIEEISGEMDKLKGHKFWVKDNEESHTLLMPKTTSDTIEYYQKLKDLSYQLANKLEALKSERAFQEVTEYHEQAKAHQKNGEPKATLLMALQSAEAVCYHIDAYTTNHHSDKLKLEDFIKKFESEEKEVLPQQVIASLWNIQHRASLGLHHQEGVKITMKDTHSCMNDLDEIVEWYLKVYHQPINVPKSTVFLAKVRDDENLERFHNEIKRDLESLNVRILSDEQYLTECNLFVQLFSDNPNTALSHYQQFQYACAQQADLPILQWQDRALDLQAVTDSEQYAQLNKTIAMSFVEFKNTLRAKLAFKQEKTFNQSHQDTLVFVDAALDDMEIARQIKIFLDEKKIGCTLPLSVSHVPDPAEIRKDLENNLLSCDAVVVPYDKTPITQIREKILFCRRMQGERDKPFKIIAVCNKPAKNKPSLSDLITLPNMEIFKCPELHVGTCLPRFIEILQTT